MKILHCCLSCFYIDDYGYQENILPKIHKSQGHDVRIVASTETYITNKKIGYTEPKDYINEDNILVSRIPYSKWIPSLINKKIRLYNGLEKNLNSFKPDIIFLHDFQFLSALDIIEYKKKNPNVKIYVDSHTDLINSGKNWIAKNILHGIFYKWIAQKIEKYVTKFYGTLPLRKKFMIDFYKIPKEKVELLPFGVDDSNIDFSQRDIISKTLREKIGFNDDDFVIISGGKIDIRKNIVNLMEAISEINHKNIKLLVFGSTNDDTKDDVLRLSECPNIKYISWINYKEIYQYFFASDLAVFPGTHSVIWEEAVGLGIPCIFKQWDGIDHIDLGGNCAFIHEGTKDIISNKINEIFSDSNYFQSMKMSAQKFRKHFKYSQIAKKAINS